MKLSYGSIIFVLAIFAAVIVAGCTVTSPSGPAATTTPGGATTTPAGTTTPSGGLTTLGSAIDFNKVKWYEYKMTMSGAGAEGMTSNMKEEFNVDYQGTNADKMTETTEVKQGGSTMTTLIEIYSDHANAGKTLGGHMQTKMDGNVISDTPIQPSEGTSSTVTSNNLLGTNSGAPLMSAGPDSVSVPGYTGAATKYTWTSTGGGSGAVWVAPTVPVPVKMTGSAAGSTYMMELVGWG